MLGAYNINLKPFESKIKFIPQIHIYKYILNSTSILHAQLNISIPYYFMPTFALVPILQCSDDYTTHDWPFLQYAYVYKKKIHFVYIYIQQYEFSLVWHARIFYLLLFSSNSCSLPSTQPHPAKKKLNPSKENKNHVTCSGYIKSRL